jgi:hypothetical protein
MMMPGSANISSAVRVTTQSTQPPRYPAASPKVTPRTR